MVESNFATAFDLDFMVETGRDIQNYTVKAPQGFRRNTYVDTEKLLTSATIEESTLARSIGDAHKTAYLKAINDYFKYGSHAAFRRMRPFKR